MPRHFDLPNHAHELTFSTYRSVRLLDNSDLAPIVLDAVKRACKRLDVTMVALVVMPNHMHLLVRPMGERPTLMQDYLAAIKRPAAFRIHRELKDSTLLTRLTHASRGFQLWQRGGGYDRNLTSANAIEASIEYIHNNPVRKQLCNEASEWPWSSWKQWHRPGESVEPFMPVVDRGAVR